MIYIESCTSHDVEDIVPLFEALMDEIHAKSGRSVQNRIVSSQDMHVLFHAGIQQEGFHLVKAFDPHTRNVVGYLSLCQSFSLYAGGLFGIMQELYVLPAYRSKGVGQSLLLFAEHLAAQLGWTRLEVSTPPLPAFQRSLEFYTRNGFENLEGRKLRKKL